MTPKLHFGAFDDYRGGWPARVAGDEIPVGMIYDCSGRRRKSRFEVETSINRLEWPSVFDTLAEARGEIMRRHHRGLAA